MKEQRILKGQYDTNAARIVATTTDVDRDGEVVSSKGVTNFADYLSRNPVILWQHSWFDAPIGKAVAGRVQDDRIELDVEWAPTPMGQEVKALYEGGFMNSFSIGFIPRKSETIDGQFTWVEWELLETSAVSIPANPMATIIRSAEEKGYQVAQLKSLCREASPEAESTAAGEVATESDADAEPKEINKKEDDMSEKEIDIEAIRKEAAEAERKRIEQEQAQKAEKERVANMEAELAELRKEKEQIAQTKAIHPGELKVGTNPEYKGINLRRGVEVFSDRLAHRGYEEAARKAVASEERTMGLIKAFHDMYVASFDLGTYDRKAVDYTNDAAGGYLSPDQFGDLLAYARLNSVALRRARTVNMTSDVMKMPRENAKVQLGFTASTAEAGETSATFEEVTLTAQDLDGYADVSMHLEMDSSTPIASLLLDQFTESYGQNIDSATFASTGDPVSGIFLSYGRSEVFDSGSTNFSEIVVGNLIAAEGKLERPRRAGAAWYIGRSSLWSHVYPLKNDNGDHYLIQDLSRPGARSLLGYPVEEVEDYPANAADTAMAVFGNLEGFIIGNRLTNLTLFRDPYSLSAKHYVRYVFWTRVGLAMALPNAFVAIASAGE